MAAAIITLALLMAVAGVLRQRRQRRRWVSPYSTFRVAGARVTRTTEHPFTITAVQVSQPG